MTGDILHINWDEFHFLRPAFLWLLIPVLLSLIIGMITINKKARWQRHIATHLRKYVIATGSEGRIKIIRAVSLLILSIAILGLAGPTWEKIQMPGKILETPVVIALDISQSMMATDIQPTRLDRAKFKIYDLLKENPHARIALVGFAGTAHVIVPLTSDYSIIEMHLEGLSPNMMPIQGSNLQAALSICDTIIQRTHAPGRIVLFSDDFSDASFDLINAISLEGTNTVDIIPMNTVIGAEIPRLNSNISFKNTDGSAVHSALNGTIIDKLSALDKVRVHPLTLDNSDVELLARTIGASLKFKEDDEEKDDDWQDRGLLLAIPFTVLALLWFRKGWVIFSIFLVTGISSCKSDGSFKDLWMTSDYRGQKAYDSGDFTEAAKLFTSDVRKGNAHYMAGEYEKAIEAYSRDTSAVGAYNLGLAYYKNGDFWQAELAFAKAVELNPEMQDALRNSELMGQIIATADSSSMEFSQAQEAGDQNQAENIQNKDMEDLGGGGQEATKEDMQKERKEETAETGQRKGKEMDFVPDDFKSGNSERNNNVVMQRVNDDPALFLKRKFEYQVRKGIVAKPKTGSVKW